MKQCCATGASVGGTTGRARFLELTEVQGVGSFCLRLCEEQVPKKEILSVVFLEGV